MYIRKYAHLRGAYVPDEGEVVLAARSPAGPWVRAAVTTVRRVGDGKIRINFVWLEDMAPERTSTRVGYRKGEPGHVFVTPGDRHSPALIRRTPATGQD